MIEISDAQRHRVSEQIIELYKNGLSTTDIAKQVGKGKTTINSLLKRTGVELRPNRALPFKATGKESAKGAIRPPFGFCYFQGKVVPDQKEYSNLLMIYRLWQQRLNPNAIAEHLNAKRIPARSAPNWNRNSIVLILKRFEEGLISLQGGHLEIR